jgi:thiamine biosynthesis lipoprotein
MKKLILFLLLPILLLAATPHHRTFLLMGTFVEFTLPKENNKLIDDTVKEMQALEDILSIYKKDSEINQINSLKKRELKKVSPEVYEVIEKSIYFSKLTDGAFDITVSPLLKLWDFEGGELKIAPNQEEINKALESVGWQNIILTPDEEIGFKKDNMSINLGGIAKGYIVDKGIAYLKEQSVKSALINAGGDVYCLGKKDDGQPWKIGIRHPKKNRGVMGTIEVANKAVTTSGDYEKFFILKGKRFSHIINPSTGYPVEGSVVQATVVTESCTDADALATALMVMGKEKGLKLIETLPNTEAVIVEEIEDKLNITYTSGLKGKIEIYE